MACSFAILISPSLSFYITTRVMKHNETFTIFICYTLSSSLGLEQLHEWSQTRGSIKSWLCRIFYQQLFHRTINVTSCNE